MTDFEIKAAPFDLGAVRTLALADQKLNDWPVVYTLNDKKQIYIGETTSATSRMTEHKKSISRKNLREVRIILHNRFHKSACHDLESHLIRFFHADGKFEVLNSNAGISDYDYFDRDSYRASFDEIFEGLRAQGLISRSIPDIVNDNLFKYSPFKSLSHDQALAIESILESMFGDGTKKPSGQLVVQGAPGTGKTIVATYLVKLLVDIMRSDPSDTLDVDSLFSDFFQPGYRELLSGWKIALVVPQQSLRKTLKSVFKATPGLHQDMVISPFDVGKSTEKWDLLIVDEAHRLKIRANMSSAQQNKDYAAINGRLFGAANVDNCELNQLDWIEKQSTNQILLLDSAQSVMPSDLPLKLIQDIEKRAKLAHNLFTLETQMRVRGGKQYVDYVSSVIDQTATAKIDGFGDYDFRIFENINEMVSQLTVKNDEKGLARLVAGFAWKWRTKKRSGSGASVKHDIEIDGVKFPWNRTATDWVNSPTSIEEVGSIHTIQGYDLNYCGVIIGKDLYFDEATGSICFDRSNYFDTKGKENNKRCGLVFTDEDLLQYVKQIYRVLLTRGIYGTYVYVCDPALRKYFQKFFPSESL